MSNKILPTKVCVLYHHALIVLKAFTMLLLSERAFFIKSNATVIMLW